MHFDAASAQGCGDYEADKLAPSTTARRAVAARSIMAWQSARERSVWTWGWSAPGMVKRIGSAPVASSNLS